jgi:exopolysaccharide production protein ExoZ
VAALPKSDTEGSTGRVESLDTLRGIAILAVITFHVSQDFKPSPGIGKLATFGGAGVQLFFLVSAITMCLMWEQRASEPRRVTKFYIRRFFRIAPMFWAAMIFYTVWAARQLDIPPNGVFTWQEVLPTALFLHGLFPGAINRVVPGGWSIADEMNFYLAFPKLAHLKNSPTRALIFAFGTFIALGVIATAAVDRLLSPPPLFLYYSLLTQFSIFPIGIFLYGTSMKRIDVDPRTGRMVVAGWVITAFSGRYLLGIDTHPFFWIEVGILATMVFFAIRRRLYLKSLSFIGGISYSMYLFHFAVVDLIKEFAPAAWGEGNFHFLAALILSVAATSAVAKLSGLTFETWSSMLARKLISGLK